MGVKFAWRWGVLLLGVGLIPGHVPLTAQEVPSSSMPASRPDPGMSGQGDLVEALTRGHQALSAMDLPTARDLAEDIRGEKDASSALAVHFFLARLAFFEGRYGEGLQLLGAASVDDPPEVARLRGMLSNLTRITTPFQQVESDHFVVKFAPGADEVLLPYLMDTLEQSYLAIGSELGHSPTEKVRLEVYPTATDFIDVSGLTRQEIETTGIVALCVYNKLMVTSPRALALGYRWLDTASHEYIHQVVAQKSGNKVPVWLQEGLAKFFEVRWRGGRAADLSPMSENLLAEALETGHFVPFERMTPSVAKLDSQEEAQLAFAQVETFIEMMVQKKGLAGIRDLMEGMKSGLSDKDAVARVMGAPFDQVVAEWKKFVAAKKPRRMAGVALMPIILEAQQLAAEGDAPEKVTDPFLEESRAMQEYTRLGDLLRDRGRYQAALLEYQKAVGASPKESPALQVKIARTHLLMGRPQEARKVLTALVERYDSFGPAWTTLAEANAALGDIKGAILAFEEANASNPFDPMVHAGLLALYTREGRKREADREEKALQLLQRG